MEVISTVLMAVLMAVALFIYAGSAVLVIWGDMTSDDAAGTMRVGDIENEL